MSARVLSIGECMIEMSGGGDDLYRLGYAGDTLNTAYYLRASLGEDWAVDYFTALGDDRYSERMRAFLASCGIGTERIRTIAGKRPGLYLIHQEAGDRHFTYWRETSAARCLADDADALADALASARTLYFSGITLAILAPEARQRLLALLGKRRSEGAMVCFDPNIRPALWANTDALKHAIGEAARVSTLVLPTHGDEAPYFGDADSAATAARYLEAGADEVVVKNGGDPALVATRDTSVEVAGPAVAEVVDATGAGDSFAGAYIAARLGGADPSAAAEAGHAMAVRVIAHHGALVPRASL